MIDSIARITLNLQETNTMVSIRAKRGDTGRKLLIHLSDGSIPYHISDDCYATFTAKKPDGTKINNACTIENNVIEYEFTDQTCTAVGTMKAEIRLYGADDKMITSACFLVNVYDTVFRDGDEVDSESEMNTLDDLILRANAFLNETGKLLRWQGNWDSETEYETNDLVLHEEVLYVAEEAIAAGTVPGSEGAAWVPIAGMGTGSGGKADFVVQDTPPEDTSVLWVDPTDNSDDGFQKAVNTALAQAKASGEFKGDPGAQGPQGEPGEDYVLTDVDKEEIAGMVEVPESGGIAVTGAKVGQTVRISAVDENGVPTAWLPTDFPSGGSVEVWEEIANATFTEDVSGCTFTEDVNGQHFQLKKASVFARIHARNSGSGGWINLDISDGTSTLVVTQLPSGFAATEGQVTYRSVKVDVTLRETESFAMAYQSQNTSTAKDNLQSFSGSASTLTSRINPLKWISSFSFRCNGSAMGANTEIFIYGVRA